MKRYEYMISYSYIKNNVLYFGSGTYISKKKWLTKKSVGQAHKDIEKRTGENRVIIINIKRIRRCK